MTSKDVFLSKKDINCFQETMASPAIAIRSEGPASTAAVDETTIDTAIDLPTATGNETMTLPRFHSSNDPSLSLETRAAILSKQIRLVGDSIVARRKLLQQGAAELRRRQEEAMQELAAITARSDELDQEASSADDSVVEMDLDEVVQVARGPLLLNVVEPTQEVSRSVRSTILVVALSHY